MIYDHRVRKLREPLRSLKSKKFTLLTSTILRSSYGLDLNSRISVTVESTLRSSFVYSTILLYFYHRSFILVPKSLSWNYNDFNIFYEIDRNQCNIPILGLKFLVNHGSLKFFSFSQEVKKSMWIFCLTIIQCFHDIIFPSINWNPLQGIEIELKTF